VEQLDHVRILAIFVYGIFRLISFRSHFQAYLSSALAKFQFLGVEKGQISLPDYQKRLKPAFHFACVAIIQFLAFPIVILLLALGLKTLGRYDFGILPTQEGPAPEEFLLGADFFRPVLTVLCWWLCVLHSVVSLLAIAAFGAVAVQKRNVE